MEQFKAVEKEMKTKAYSKEGLSAASRLDPKEKEKVEACDFLSSMVDELQQRIEAMEAEEETLQAQMKKGKKDSNKANRMADISRVTERHKWHVNKLEFLNRSLQNGNLEVNQVLDLKESIKYYVDEGHNIDYSGEDETLYDDLDIGEEIEAQFGMGAENDRVSSHDAQSIQDDEPEPKPKPSKADPTPHRRPSTQMKSPLPVLATLHPSASSSATPSMKPAPLPTRLPGETLKYASAAAAAAASDKSGVGILPLPPPPGGASPAFSHVLPASKASSTASPVVASVQPVAKPATTAGPSAPPAVSASSSEEAVPLAVRTKTVADAAASGASSPAPTPAPKAESMKEKPTTNGKMTPREAVEGDESLFHLPPGLQELIQSFEVTKERATANPTPAVQRLLATSLTTCPEPGDAEKPRHYKPQNPYNTPLYYPQEPLSIFDDPRLYDTGRIDTDTLFYLFYYRQGSYQQYLAAKALKNQSWRFHKQYQTWFQRHEEPKNITEEFEQGTYRFFDYESTWLVPSYPSFPIFPHHKARAHHFLPDRMNRRKADFKFVYKYLEDEL